MQMKGRHTAGLSAVAAIAALFALGFDASAQDAGKDAKKAPPKTASVCKGLDEKACRGKATDCLWIVPKKGKQPPYCRVRTASKTKKT